MLVSPIRHIFRRSSAREQGQQKAAEGKVRIERRTLKDELEELKKNTIHY